MNSKRTPPGGATALRAGDALRAALPSAAPMRLLAADGGRADVDVGGVRLVVGWVGEGRPGAVRAVLDAAEAPSALVIAGRRLPRAARAAAAERGAGWVDESGAAMIMVPGLIVDRQGVAGPSAPPGWTRATLAIAESVLLGHPATVAATHAATGLSVGACARGLRVLADAGFIAAPQARGRGAGRELADADGLLGAYVDAQRRLRRPGVVTCAVPEPELWERVRAAGATWSGAGPRWAVGGIAGAHLTAPILTGVASVEVLLDAASPADLRAAADVAGLRPAEGGRLALRAATSPGTFTFTRDVDGLRVAPWPALYADALELGVRGEDAALHLLEVVRGG